MFPNFFLWFFLFFPVFANSQVRYGLDILNAQNYTILNGKKIGLICNQTSVTSSGEFAPKLFAKQKLFTLAALFSPEHGLFGERRAGVSSDTIEKFEGIPIYSLYGSTRKPTKKMLKEITTLVFDIQDIGVRPYTYLSTMIYTMEAAAENNIEFIVLDRPNPLSGERIEGNILDTTYRSFVGVIPIPYLHGMTLGELAEMAKGERWFHSAEKLKLTVVKMTGWKRSMYWNETELKWIAPSPNIPTFESAIGCAMFGAIGELGILSVGIGSDLPFLRIGSKLVKPEILEDVVKTSLTEGITAKREDYIVPYGDSTKTFLGMKIELPKSLNDIGDIYRAEFLMINKLLKDSVFLKSFNLLFLNGRKMFEKVTGTHELLKAFEFAEEIEPVLTNWKKDVACFRVQRKKYLLYS